MIFKGCYIIFTGIIVQEKGCFVMFDKTDLENYQGVYKELVELLGYDLAKKINTLYGGHQIDFPKGFLNKKRQNEIIFELYSKGDIRVSEIAKEFDIGERQVRAIIAKMRKSNED